MNTQPSQELLPWNKYIFELAKSAPTLAGLVTVLNAYTLLREACATVGQLRNWRPIFVEFLGRLSELSELQQEEFIAQWETYHTNLELTDSGYWYQLLQAIIKIKPLGHPHWANHYVMRDVVWNAIRKLE